jgi:hypothetical protein
MPASLPDVDRTANLANPSGGRGVTFDPLSGPKAAPLDARKFNYATGTPLGWDATTKVPIVVNDPTNLSTGALSTGIGFGLRQVCGAVVAGRFNDGNFTDNYVPGQTKPDGTAAADARMMYIGGGRSTVTGAPNPITLAAVGICAAGTGANGGSGTATASPPAIVAGSSRDAGTTPFTGFPLRAVTAPGAVAVDVAVGDAQEPGAINRSGKALTTGQTLFASSATALADTTLLLAASEAEETRQLTGPEAEESADEEDEDDNGNGDEDEDEDEDDVARTPRRAPARRPTTRGARLTPTRRAPPRKAK